MSLILHIETATDVCSVSIAKNGVLLGTVESTEGKSHARMLNSFIEELLRKEGVQFNELTAVAVSKGPGSYTGLRIGVAAAKGFCYALNIPLIAINTLQAMTAFLISKDAKNFQSQESFLFAPLIDARRMEVYTAVFNNQLHFMENTKAEIISQDSFKAYSEENKIIFFGDGEAKSKAVLQHSGNAIFVEDFKASATGMIALAQADFEEKKFEDIAYFEPFYLKDFVSNQPRKVV